MATPSSDERVLDAATRVLERSGGRALTAERVATEAGLSRVTLHRRGWTRGAILAALATRAEVRYRERMWPVLTAAGGGFDRLRQALFVLCDLAEENLALLVALDAEANAAVFHEDAEVQALTRSPFTEPLERLLLDGAADGTISDFDPAETATLLFNMVGWTYVHLRSAHRWSAEGASTAAIKLVLGGVSPR